MNDKGLHTPEGVRDIYGKPCEKKLYLQDMLFSIIKGYGYRPIETPAFEFFETFSDEAGTTDLRDMFKFFDHEGNILVLRPDMTPPIVRCVGKYFSGSDMPKKFCYCGNTFLSHKSYRGKKFEYTQLGAEYLGVGSADSDAEVAAVMIRCMDACGLRDYKVIAGHAALDEEAIKAAGIAHEFVDDIGGLKELFREIKDEKISGAVGEMIALEEALTDHGLGGRVEYELGLGSTYEYYTGVIFSVYAKGCGHPIAGGGRYDKLARHFGTGDAAIGFAITIDSLLATLEKTEVDFYPGQSRVLIVYDRKRRRNALQKAAELRKNCDSVELMIRQSNAGNVIYESYAAEKEIGEIVYIE